MVDLRPCANCQRPAPLFRKERGHSDITRARWYRETVECRHCNIVITAKTPGNAVAFWNRAFAGLTAKATAEREGAK